MNVVWDIKCKFNELQPKFMDVIFYVSLMSRLVYTMLKIPQNFSAFLYLNLSFQ